MWIEEGAISLAYSQLLRGRALVRGGEWEKWVDGFLNALYFLSWYTTDKRQKVVALKNSIYIEHHRLTKRMEGGRDQAKPPSILPLLVSQKPKEEPWVPLEDEVMDFLSSPCELDIGSLCQPPHPTHHHHKLSVLLLFKLDH